MKVSQLIAQLQGMDPDAEVHYSYNYGDHWRTTVAPTVEQIDEACIKYSDYHRMHKVVDDYEEQGEEDTKTVVLLS
jgi:hypothetical protein